MSALSNVTETIRGYTPSILSLVENNSIQTGQSLCYVHGMVAYWKTGILGQKLYTEAFV
jgi:hypothetical protein